MVSPRRLSSERMTRSEQQQQSSERPFWVPRTQTAGRSVETLQLQSGATLIHSHIDPGERQSFCFTEPEDTFGFGFHSKGGANGCCQWKTA